MAATETGAGLAAAAFLYVVKILNGRATYGEFAYTYVYIYVVCSCTHILLAA